MNSKQRMALAMQHGIPDRVPVMCQLSLGHYFLTMRSRWKPYEIFFSSEAFADALVAMCRRYRFDGILINIPGRDPAWRDAIQTVEEHQDGELLTWQDGTHTLVPWDDSPLFELDDSSAAPRPDYEAFDPDRDMDRLDEWPRYTWGVYHIPRVTGKAPGLLLEPPDTFFRTIDLVRAAVGDSLSVHGEVFSPFTHFMELFGYQEALLGLMTDPGKAEAILARFAETTIAWGRAQARRGVDAVLISSAFAGGGFISPHMYERFVVPCERKVADALHAAVPGLPVYTHTCGLLYDRLELLAETRVDGVDTLDPPPLGNTDLADAKRRIGHRLFIKGNMNSVAILTDSKGQFVQRATDTLLAGKPGGGYILSTACSVAPRVEPWKLELLADIAEEDGRYR
ncbi:MAG: uroporphyrinogen decarboxylase family protein [Anaerolineae bacterium]|nr:uroporphyrinogen decarboxylase family protein [Anaerolineae bacterium]